MKKLTTFAAIAGLAFCLASCSKDFNSGFESMVGGDVCPPENQSGDKFEEFADNEFVSAAENPVSTFSVDADGAAYAIVRNYIDAGFNVPKNAVRIEELLNYFTFDYADPTEGEALAINAEVGVCPWAPNHKLVRLGLKGKPLAKDELPLSNYVFLVDVSGSMDNPSKLPLLKKGLIELASHLEPEDRISIITYSGNVKKLLESTPAKENDKIVKAINKLSASGFTNGGDAINMAYNEALANFIPGGNNRIILGTDGDFNVGKVSTEDLLELVSANADKGIYLTALGFGMGNLNDAMMEQISNRGNGTYFFIDSEEEMIKVLCNEKNKFVSTVNDCKIQLHFDPEKVDSYRLIGYENRVMSNEDFEDDSKDAGEIGAGQTITALYEIIPQPSFNNGDKVASFDVRYKETLGDSSKEMCIDVAEWVESSSNLDFAAGVTAFGLVMRDSKFKGAASIEMAKELAGRALEFDPFGYRRDFIGLLDKLIENQKKK